MRVQWLLMMLVVASGCLRSQVEPCGNVLCPAGAICVASGCASPREVAACQGLYEGSACDVGLAGVCEGGACRTSTCGDGIINQTAGEVCDDRNNTSGDGCASDCRSDETCGNGVVDGAVGEECDGGPNCRAPGQHGCSIIRCGNGVLDPGEVCDDGNLLAGDGCAPSCQSDEACGNGIIDGSNREECDGGEDCRPPGLGGCRLIRCGNGWLDDVEVCDDGNLVPADGCAADCLSNEQCGNGVIDGGRGEECDGGPGCRPPGDLGCKVIRCGNLVIDPGEICDDGNLIPGDGCAPDCRSLETCGNGIIDGTRGEECDGGPGCRPPGDLGCKIIRCGNLVLDPGEICDDGNLIPGDGCAPDCRSLETCGNGIIDVTRGEECDDGNQRDDDRCHHTCLVPRCGDGIVDIDFNEHCDLGTANSNGPNAACTQQCSLPSCGDGVVDTVARAGSDTYRDEQGTLVQVSRALPIEICDDRNNISGDGCAADCQSNETCGNGYADFLAGEQCDDATSTGLSGDACDSRCQIEANFRWTRMNLPVYPTSPAIAYDAHNRRFVVLEGGQLNPAQPGVRPIQPWFLKNDNWSTDVPRVRPTQRIYADHAMAYDISRAELVVFGGADTNTARTSDDYPGLLRHGEWRLGEPVPASLRARIGHTMIYDPHAQRIVLFGGSPYTTSPQPLPPYNDLWFYANGQWQQGPAAPAGLVARRHHAMAYDTVNQRLVIFGGQDATAGVRNDTWYFSNGAWTQGPSAPANLTARRTSTMAYDRANNRVILHGGLDGSATRLRDTWALANNRWSRLSTTSPVAGYTATPTQLSGVVSYDPDQQRVLLFFANLVFTLNGTSWQQLTYAQPSDVPAARYGGGLVFDSHRNRIVLFGGTDDVAAMNDTWMLTGDAWTRGPAAPAALAPRANHAMAYDRMEQRIVLFSGLINKADTWFFQNNQWTPGPTAPTGLAYRQRHAMAYDDDQARIVVHGGQGRDGPLADTWYLQGNTWSQGPTAATPRYGHAMVYDNHARRLIVMGGANTSGRVEETLYLQAGQWQAGPRLPSNLGGPAIYHPLLRRVLLISNNELWQLYQDVWSYVGTAPQDYALRNQQALVYTPGANMLTMFGGDTGTGFGLNETWRLGPGYTNRVTSTQDCSGVGDTDHDGALPPADPDCAAYTRPLCISYSACDPEPGRTAPSSLLATQVRCGDGVCDYLEANSVCPADCAVCGDMVCEATRETAASCLLDCN